MCPFPQHVLVQGDVTQHPVVVDTVKASLDVPFHNPTRTVTIAQQQVNLLQGVGTAAFQAKTLGVVVGLRFRDGVQGRHL